MKVWKSPVLYFGVLLMLAVGPAAAPFVVDWNSYRADLESYGKKLTGRTVTIEGPISARLFPWPRLTADNVTSPIRRACRDAPFRAAERITVRMTLAGLAQGGIDVQSIEVDEPALMLERRATGEGNWVFTPSADLIEERHSLARPAGPDQPQGRQRQLQRQAPRRNIEARRRQCHAGLARHRRSMAGALAGPLRRPPARHFA
jgi:uncharacterized protein involved in outer membrane biogenesis